MRRLALIVVVLLSCVAVPSAEAGASSSAHRQIGEVIDRFVKDVVLRRNLVEGWALAGPDLRGGTTRSAWMSGKGVTVEAFPAIGNDFRHAWTGSFVSPTRAELTVTLHSTGRDAEVIEAQAVVVKRRGRWLVDIFYPAGIIRLGRSHNGSCGRAGCAISGPNDFGPQSAAGGQEGVPARTAAHWLWIVLGSLGGFLAAGLAGLALYVRLRDRRARLAYEASRFRSSRSTSS
jgi:hypothetical protein